MRLLDAQGVEVASLPTDPDVNIQEVAFSPGGERLIGGGWGDEGVGEVMVWNVASGRHLAWLRPLESVFAVAVSFDRQLAATGASDGAIQLWDVEASTLSATLEGHEGAVQALTFDPAGRRLASASSDGTVRIWDLGRIAPLPRLRGHPDGICDVTFSTDGRRLVTVSANSTTWIWDGERGGPIACPYSSTDVVLLGGPPRNGVFADGERILSLACGATWDSATGAAIRVDHDEEPFWFASRHIAWAPGGRLFAAFGWHSSEFGIYTPERLDQPVWLKGHEGDVGCVVFSPDGKQLVSGSQDGTVRVWDAETGTPLTLLRGHEGEITCVGFSSSGDRIVSSATDQTVRVWEVASGAEVHRLRIEDPGVSSRGWSSDGANWEVHAIAAVAFSADDRRILTLSERTRIRVWDPATGACLRTIEGEGDFQAVATGLPWQALVRDGVLEVEVSGTRDIVARAYLSPEFGA